MQICRFFLLLFFSIAYTQEHRSINLELSPGVIYLESYQPSQQIAQAVSGNSIAIPSKYAVGFCVDADLGLDFDTWHASIKYDYYDAPTSSIHEQTSAIALYQIATAPTTITEIDASLAVMHKSLRLEILKAIGYWKIHCGFIADWQHQDFNLLYNKTFSSSQTFDAWGAGLRSGMYLSYPIICAKNTTLSLECSFAIAALWTRFRLFRTDCTPAIETLALRTNIWEIKGSYEAAMGILASYKQAFIAISAFESIWMNNNILLLLDGDMPQGDFSLVGLRALIGIRF